MRAVSVLLTLSVACSACDSPGPSTPAPPAIEPVAVSQPLEPTAAGLAIASLDEEIAFTKKRAAEQGGWIHHARVADAFLARARLTGAVEDYVQAEAALQRAFENARPGAGPFLTRASFNMTVHRIERVEEDLIAFEQRVIKKTDEVAATAGLRGDVALQHGDLTDAERFYRESEEGAPGLQSAGRLANLYVEQGNLDEAAAWYDRALERVNRRDDGQRAWSLLQRGNVEFERGDIAAALGWFEQADAAFDGWYLVERRIADVLFAQGDIDGALARYEAIVARVPNGDLLADYADILEASGDAAQAAKVRASAATAFERDIAKLESAVAVHALDFFLATDPQRALTLARRTFEARPGPESRTRLAQALLINGNAEEAKAVLAPSAAPN